MEKEKEILTDDQLKDVSGGWSLPNFCGQFDRRDVCEKLSRGKCQWYELTRMCIDKVS